MKSMTCVVALAFVACSFVAHAEELTVTLRGRVLDAQTGEPIAKARISLVGTKIDAVSDADGRFTLPGVSRGEAEISATTVGYGVERRKLVAGPESAELEIRLSQEALRRSEEVAVASAPFEALDPAAPAAHRLEGGDLENLASVLVDDPLRSVQSLPGVTTSDDFGATFASRGLGFRNVGLYIDGVLLTAPFHTIRDSNDAFSLSLMNGDTVESIALIPGAAPSQYGDRIGAVLSLKSRSGSHEEFFGRASLGATGISTTLEGPIGAAKKTSWLISARKSYLDYVLERLDETGIVIGFYDATARLTHRASPTQTLSLSLLFGRSSWKDAGTNLRPSDTLTADAGTGLATLQWRWLPSPRMWVETAASYARETGTNRAVDGTDRFRSTGEQWALRTNATRVMGRHSLSAGLLLRALSEETIGRGFDGARASYVVTQNYDVRSSQGGGYIQDTWAGFRDRLSVTAGLRFDHFAETGETSVMPRGSLTWRLTSKTKLMAGLGTFAQFPDFERLFGERGNPDLRAEQASHYLLAVEHSLGQKTRIRAEAYEERLSGLLFAPDSEWRLEGGRGAPPRLTSIYRNELSGPSRGFELLVQRRSANLVSGWIAYSYGQTRFQDSEGGEFDSDFDQRHTLTVYGTTRLSPTLNLSAKYRYGSGFPVAGFYEGRPDGPYLSSARNLYRPETYSRVDVRLNKAFIFSRAKLTLYAEVINLLNRTHTRYNDLDAIDPRTGRVFLDSDTLFPLLPTVGITVEF